MNKEEKLHSGIIISIGRHIGTVMERGGKIQSIKLKGKMRLGQKILFTEDDICRTASPLILAFPAVKPSIAAAAIILVSLSPLVNHMFIPSAVVSVDVNPGIEFFISSTGIVRNDRISKDSEKLSDGSLKLKGKPLNAALQELHSNLEKNHLIEKNTPVLASYSPTRTIFVFNKSGLQSRAEKAVQETFADQQLYLITNTVQGYKESRKSSMSIGRFTAEKIITQKLEEAGVEKNVTLDFACDDIPKIIHFITDAFSEDHSVNDAEPQQNSEKKETQNVPPAAENQSEAVRPEKPVAEQTAEQAPDFYKNRAVKISENSSTESAQSYAGNSSSSSESEDSDDSDDDNSSDDSDDDDSSDDSDDSDDDNSPE